MTPAAPRPTRAPLHLTVRRTEEVGEQIVRVVLGGPAVIGVADEPSTDRYLKLLFAPPGVVYDDPTDVAGIRSSRPAAEHPRARTYTVRWVDPDAAELAIDVVLHGDAGIAAPWSRTARPGDEVVALGPGGGYRPDRSADWHLFMADDAALPAVAAALDQLPDDATVLGLLALDLPGRARYLGERFADRFEVVDRAVGPNLTGLLDRADLPPGDGQAFIHGELGEVRSLRPRLADRFTRDRLSLSGYWREGKDEDGFQAEKRTEAAAAG